MKTFRTITVAIALTALAALAGIPTVHAGDSTSKGLVNRAALPKPTCPPGDPNGCGIYK